MAPKKKGGKKAADDWEDELGEVPDPIAQATQDAKDAEAAADGEESGGGGLMAALRKNKDKRKKKGKVDDNFDFVEGEDPPPVEVVLEDKKPEEANIEDEDVFANAGAKKGKGGKKDVKAAPTATPAAGGDDDEDGEGGGMKSKKEKEKEKREREKARKKEQVSLGS